MPVPAMNCRRDREAAARRVSSILLSRLRALTIERVDYANVRVRRHFHEGSVRPGGTISGPTMMELADFAMYVAVFSVCWSGQPHGGHDQSQH